MYDNYNYPAGSDTPDAPWNEPTTPDMDFEVTCSQTLSRTVTVTTNNYVPGASGVDYEPNDEGGYDACGYQDLADTSDTNWADEYHSNGYYTPLQLIQLLGEVLKNDLEHGIVFKNPKFTQNLINECEGWAEDETEFVEE